jgi:hypothetical protein
MEGEERVTLGQVWAAVFDEAGWREARRDLASLFRVERARRRGRARLEARAGEVPPGMREWLLLAWKLRGFESGSRLGRTVLPEGEMGLGATVPPGWVFVLRGDGQMAVGNPENGQAYVLLPAPEVVH